VPSRRPSPIHLLLVLVLACLAPLGVVLATGLAGGPVDDQVETADDGGDGGAGATDLAARSGDAGTGAAGTGDAGTGGSTTTVAPTTTSAPAPTTTTSTPPATPAPTAPATTAPPATAPPATAPPPAPPPPSAPGDQVVALVNAARAQAGCGALRSDPRLAAAAQGHSDDMAAQDYFSHTSLDGRTFADRVRAAGYASPGGENIAQGQRSAQAVHDAWMNSEGHRANILNCGFTAIGVGLHAGTWTWTQNFGY
jgi:uncharacterized protein YkwD